MSDCIFCKIAAGQMKANTVLENEHVVAFRDINPQSPVHILIIPKKHVERVSSLVERDFFYLAEIHRAAQELARSEKIEESGYRLVVNNGADAGQTVDHLHYHLLGGRHLGWPPG